MGRTLVKLISETDGFTLTHGFERSDSPYLSTDSGELAAIGRNGVLVSDDIASGTFDTLIDFTTPETTLRNANYCAASGKSMVIGTTGLTESDRLVLEQHSRIIPIVFAPNMSVGVNLTLKLLETSAKVIGKDSSIEIIETHHRYKVDSPSGTALKMGEVVANALGRDLANCAVYGREGIDEPRDLNTIGFSSIRGGDVVGDHTVTFFMEGERVEITHKASSRMIYANGAVRAANWLHDKPSGLYSMQDVLEL